MTPVVPGTDRWYLSAAPIWRALVHLCVPMAAGVSVGAVYNLINAGFVGSLHDTALLAALTFGLPLMGLVMAVGGVFGVGASALISRLLGAAEHDPAQAGRIRHVSSFAACWRTRTGRATLHACRARCAAPRSRSACWWRSSRRRCSCSATTCSASSRRART